MSIFERTTTKASNLNRFHKVAILQPKNAQLTIRLILPGELCKHSVSEGTKAVTKFTAK